MHLLQYQFSLHVLSLSCNVILPTIIGIMQYQMFYKNFKWFKKLCQLEQDYYNVYDIYSECYNSLCSLTFCFVVTCIFEGFVCFKLHYCWCVCV